MDETAVTMSLYTYTEHPSLKTSLLEPQVEIHLSEARCLMICCSLLTSPRVVKRAPFQPPYCCYPVSRLLNNTKAGPVSLNLWNWVWLHSLHRLHPLQVHTLSTFSSAMKRHPYVLVAGISEEFQATSLNLHKIWSLFQKHADPLWKIISQVVLHGEATNVYFYTNESCVRLHNGYLCLPS